MEAIAILFHSKVFGTVRIQLLGITQKLMHKTLIKRHCIRSVSIQIALGCNTVGLLKYTS